MPLDRFFGGNPNIKEIVLSPEKEPVLESQKMYERLKSTLLYNKEYGVWEWFIVENQTMVLAPGRQCQTDSQLMGVLVEAIFDKKLAKEQYEKLKSRDFFDDERGRWNVAFNPPDGFVNEGPISIAQLLDVLVESIFNKNEKEVKKMYEECKHTFFIKGDIYWYPVPRTRERTVHFASEQLLSVLTESLFDRASAEKRYKELKKTSLYDTITGQWNVKPEEYASESYTSKEPFDHRYSYDQLLGILVENLFNPKLASKKYNQLRDTLLYDKERKQWNYIMSGNQQRIINYDRISSVQLLDILVHHELFEKREQKELERVVPVTPKIKKF